MTSQLKTLSGNFQKIDMISCYGRRLSWQANLGKAAMFISGSLLQTFAWVVASPQDMGNTKTANSLLGTLLDFDGYLHWLKTVDLILVGLVLILGFRRNCAAQSNSCGLHWPHQEVLTGDAFLQWAFCRKALGGLGCRWIGPEASLDFGFVAWRLHKYDLNSKLSMGPDIPPSKQYRKWVWGSSLMSLLCNSSSQHFENLIHDPAASSCLTLKVEV